MQIEPNKVYLCAEDSSKYRWSLWKKVGRWYVYWDGSWIRSTMSASTRKSLVELNEFLGK